MVQKTFNVPTNLSVLLAIDNGPLSNEGLRVWTNLPDGLRLGETVKP